MRAIQSKPSLRNRLLRHVLLPLAATWLLGSMLMLGVASYFTQQAYDRALLDDAYLVASHVRLDATDDAPELSLSLSAQEMSAVLFDQSERMFFAVLRKNGALIAGHAGLHPSRLDDWSAPQFETLFYQNKQLRSVTLYRQQPAEFAVVMAQTTTSRDRLLQRLVVFALAPQVLLLIALAIGLQRAIKEDLRPLSDLASALGERDARDLTPVPVSATTQDIERLSLAINALMQRIAHSVRAQREFSGNVAHELRTPLAGIRALADYGLRQASPQVWREQLQGIVQSQERASHLIDQLLALALADEAQQQWACEPVALHVVVRDVVLRFMPRADSLQVDLGAVGLEHAVTVLGNQALIEGVLNNLIDNALRYGRAAVGESRITVALVEAPQTFVLSVIDNGPGVSTQQQQQLSQRWVKGSAGEALKEGAGLGLAIVHEYARLLGAVVTLQNGAPNGLRVSLAFPKPDTSMRSAGPGVHL